MGLAYGRFRDCLLVASWRLGVGRGVGGSIYVDSIPGWLASQPMLLFCPRFRPFFVLLFSSICFVLFFLMFSLARRKWCVCRLSFFFFLANTWPATNCSDSDQQATAIFLLTTRGRRKSQRRAKNPPPPSHTQSKPTASACRRPTQHSPRSMITTGETWRTRHGGASRWLCRTT